MNQPVPFGKYYLLERINVGGMAEVFKAKAFGVEGFERLVAVKRILPNIAEDEEFITMFIDEAKIAVQLQHANIAQIFDLGRVNDGNIDDSYFIALEYVYGKDLRAIFDHLRKTDERMPAEQVCYVMMQVCEGLDYAHNKKDGQGRELHLVHRDVSPQNVLVGYEGEIKLVDFGIAKAAGKASKTQAGILKGKFGYMSPEQVRGLPVDRRSDVFAVGICMYEMLTGERLFSGESDFSTLEKVRNVEILPPSSFNRQIAPELERIVLKALAKEVEDRYQSAIDLHDDLQAYLYSIGSFFSRKDLASWMKGVFSAELDEEAKKNKQWEQLEQPTPGPTAFGEALRAANAHHHGRGHEHHGSARAKPKSELEWDDEELETQIFDRAPEGAVATVEHDSELTSSDILLSDTDLGPMDDQTAIAPPPDEAQLHFGEEPSPPPVRATSTYQPVARGLSGGPPLGLSAYRDTAPHPKPDVQPGQSQPWSFAGPQGVAPQPQPQPQPGGSPFRQTIMGLPQMQPGHYQTAPMPVAPPPPAYAQPYHPGEGTGVSRRFPVLLLGTIALLLFGGYIAYSLLYRPGKLVIEVNPSDAEIWLDKGRLRVVDGTVTVERPPGQYQLSFVKEGYASEDRTVMIEAGDDQKMLVEMEASGDTGFELTSDPPAQLVWLDGKPFTSGDPAGPQVRTDFRASRIAPGPHTLEIRGDPRFKPWVHEFNQLPGKMMVFRAQLVPASASDPTPPPKAEPSSVREPPPVEVAVDKPAAKPPEAAPSPGPASSPPPARPAPSSSRPSEAANKPPASPSASPSASASSPTPSPSARPPAPERTRPRPVASARPSEAEVPRVPAARASGGCTITVGSSPWAEVWIDGRNTKQVTPLFKHKVPCGRHRLTLKNPELKLEKTESITLRAGEEFKKSIKLLD